MDIRLFLAVCILAALAGAAYRESRPEIMIIQNIKGYTFVDDRPVWLSRVDGHAGWANGKAMEIAGITDETEDPEDGKIIRDADGNPTGVFIKGLRGQ